MAKQITQLPVAASVAASDVFPLDQSGTTKQATLTAIAAGLPAGTGTGGLVRQTNPSFYGGVRITDSVYPFTQLTNTAAPTDKKRLRAYVETSGATGLARVNDAENVGFPLIAWDVNNSAYLGAPLFMSAPTVTLATFSGSPGVSAYCGLRVTCADASTSAARTAFFDVSNESGANVASLWADVATDGSANLRFLTTPAGSRSSDRRVERVRVTGEGNVGIGTTNTPSKLTVGGDIRLQNNNDKYFFTDTGGTTPYFVSASNGQFYFTGTTAAGGYRPVWECAMRSDTSPLQVNVPLKIGGAGASISAVYTAVVDLALGTIPANGGVQTIDITVTGATQNSTVTINCISALSNSSIIFKADCVNPNTVRIYFVNPTASSVTLSNADYRITVIKFA